MAKEDTECTCSGYFGFAASCLALYSFYGELVNEEYGRHVQPQT